MELVKKLDYYCTPAGLELLDKNPDFINSVWFNDSKRNFWFEKDGGKKKFTRIYDGENIYVEKTGTSFEELKVYGEFEDLIKENSWNGLKMAETYFGDDNKILLKYYPISFNPHDSLDRDKLSLETLDNLSEISWFHVETCMDKEGNMFLIDPHR